MDREIGVDVKRSVNEKQRCKMIKKIALVPPRKCIVLKDYTK